MTDAEEFPAIDPVMEERIRNRAYELYQARGGDHGADIDDWTRAEEEIRLETEQAVDAGPDDAFAAAT